MAETQPEGLPKSAAATTFRGRPSPSSSPPQLDPNTSSFMTSSTIATLVNTTHTLATNFLPTPSSHLPPPFSNDLPSSSSLNSWSTATTTTAFPSLCPTSSSAILPSHNGLLATTPQADDALMFRQINNNMPHFLSMEQQHLKLNSNNIDSSNVHETNDRYDTKDHSSNNNNNNNKRQHLLDNKHVMSPSSSLLEQPSGASFKLHKQYSSNNTVNNIDAGNTNYKCNATTLYASVPHNIPESRLRHQLPQTIIANHNNNITNKLSTNGTNNGSSSSSSQFVAGYNDSNTAWRRNMTNSNNNALANKKSNNNNGQQQQQTSSTNNINNNNRRNPTTVSSSGSNNNLNTPKQQPFLMLQNPQESNADLNVLNDSSKNIHNLNIASGGIISDIALAPLKATANSPATAAVDFYNIQQNLSPYNTNSIPVDPVSTNGCAVILASANNNSNTNVIPPSLSSLCLGTTATVPLRHEAFTLEHGTLTDSTSNYNLEDSHLTSRTASSSSIVGASLCHEHNYDHESYQSSSKPSNSHELTMASSTPAINSNCDPCSNINHTINIKGDSYYYANGSDDIDHNNYSNVTSVPSMPIHRSTLTTTSHTLKRQDSNDLNRNKKGVINNNTATHYCSPNSSFDNVNTNSQLHLPTSYTNNSENADHHNNNFNNNSFNKNNNPSVLNGTQGAKNTTEVSTAHATAGGPVVSNLETTAATLKEASSQRNNINLQNNHTSNIFSNDNIKIARGNKRLEAKSSITGQQQLFTGVAGATHCNNNNKISALPTSSGSPSRNVSQTELDKRITYAPTAASLLTAPATRVNSNLQQQSRLLLRNHDTRWWVLRGLYRPGHMYCTSRRLRKRHASWSPRGSRASSKPSEAAWWLAVALRNKTGSSSNKKPVAAPGNSVAATTASSSNETSQKKHDSQSIYDNTNARVEDTTKVQPVTQTAATSASTSHRTRLFDAPLLQTNYDKKTDMKENVNLYQSGNRNQSLSSASSSNEKKDFTINFHDKNNITDFNTKKQNCEAHLQEYPQHSSSSHLSDKQAVETIHNQQHVSTDSAAHQHHLASPTAYYSNSPATINAQQSTLIHNSEGVGTNNATNFETLYTAQSHVRHQQLRQQTPSHVLPTATAAVMIPRNVLPSSEEATAAAVILQQQQQQQHASDATFNTAGPNSSMLVQDATGKRLHWVTHTATPSHLFPAHHLLTPQQQQQQLSHHLFHQQQRGGHHVQPAPTNAMHYPPVLIDGQYFAAAGLGQHPAAAPIFILTNAPTSGAHHSLDPTSIVSAAYLSDGSNNNVPATHLSPRPGNSPSPVVAQNSQVMQPLTAAANTYNTSHHSIKQHHVVPSTSGEYWLTTAATPPGTFASTTTTLGVSSDPQSNGTTNNTMISKQQHGAPSPSPYIMDSASALQQQQRLVAQSRPRAVSSTFNNKQQRASPVYTVLKPEGFEPYDRTQAVSTTPFNNNASYPPHMLYRNDVFQYGHIQQPLLPTQNQTRTDSSEMNVEVKSTSANLRGKLSRQRQSVPAAGLYWTAVVQQNHNTFELDRRQQHTMQPSSRTRASTVSANGSEVMNVIVDSSQVGGNNVSETTTTSSTSAQGVLAVCPVPPAPYFSTWYHEPDTSPAYLLTVSRSISNSIKHFVASVDQELVTKTCPVRNQIIQLLRGEILRFLNKSPTAAKYLPVSAKLHPKHRNRLGPQVDIVIYGSCSSNLSLPWSDIDLAISGLEISPLNKSNALPGTVSPVNGTLHNGTFHPAHHTLGGRTAGFDPASGQMDARHEVLAQLGLFFDKNDESWDARRKTASPQLKCRHEILQNFCAPQFKPSKHTPILTLQFNSDASKTAITNHVDISMHDAKHTGLGAIRTLKFYLSFFSTLRPLILVLKQVLLRRQMNIPYEGGLSSYALSLMVVAFLQTPELYQGRLYDVGEFQIDDPPVNNNRYQLLNLLAFYGDISVPSSGAILVKPWAGTTYGAGGTTWDDKMPRSNASSGVKIASFNYYNVGIIAMSPETFIRSATFTKLLKLMNEKAGKPMDSVSNLNPVPHPTESRDATSNESGPSSKQDDVLTPITNVNETFGPPLGDTENQVVCHNKLPRPSYASVVSCPERSTAKKNIETSTQKDNENHSDCMSTQQRSQSLEKFNAERTENKEEEEEEEEEGRDDECSSRHRSNSENSNRKNSINANKDCIKADSKYCFNKNNDPSKNDDDDDDEVDKKNGLYFEEEKTERNVDENYKNDNDNDNENDNYNEHDDANNKHSKAADLTKCFSPGSLKHDERLSSVEDLEDRLVKQHSISSNDINNNNINGCSSNSIKTNEDNIANVENGLHKILPSPDTSTTVDAILDANKKELSNNNKSVAQPNNGTDTDLITFSTEASTTTGTTAPYLSPSPSSNTLGTSTGTDTCSPTSGGANSSLRQFSNNHQDPSYLSSLVQPASAADECRTTEDDNNDAAVCQYSEVFQLLSPYTKSDNFVGCRLDVKDPIDPDNNVGRPCWNVNGIKAVFAHAYRDLLTTKKCIYCSQTDVLEAPFGTTPTAAERLNGKEKADFNSPDFWKLDLERLSYELNKTVSHQVSVPTVPTGIPVQLSSRCSCKHILKLIL